MPFNSYLLQSSTKEELFEEKEEDGNLVLKWEELLKVLCCLQCDQVKSCSNLVLRSKIFHLCRPVKSSSECLFFLLCPYE